MFTTAEDVDNLSLQFSSPKRLRDLNIDLVFAATGNAKPVLIETPNFRPEISSKAGKLCVGMREGDASDISKVSFIYVPSSHVFEHF